MNLLPGTLGVTEDPVTSVCTGTARAPCRARSGTEGGGPIVVCAATLVDMLVEGRTRREANPPGAAENTELPEVDAVHAIPSVLYATLSVAPVPLAIHTVPFHATLEADVVNSALPEADAVQVVPFEL